MANITVIGLSGQSIFMEVNEFHKKGETIKANNICIEPGGKGYNQAVACARLGNDVSFISCVGNDSYGKHCIEYLKKEHIKPYIIYKNSPTPVATIITNKDGENQVTVYPGCSNELSVFDLKQFEDIIIKSDILLIQEEIPYEVLQRALMVAKQNNVYTILNPAPAVYDISELLPFIDLLIPNEIEAKTIFNLDINNISYQSMPIVITLGSEGALIIDEKGKTKIHGNKVEVQDTTGAGDVFVACIASFIKEKSLQECVVLANKVASLHIQKKYVMNAIPYLKDIK